MARLAWAAAGLAAVLCAVLSVTYHSVGKVIERKKTR